MKSITKIRGLTLLACRHGKYVGSYIKGRWADQSELIDVPREQQTGWGFKLDIMLGHTIRPVPMFWKKGFITNEPLIGDVPEQKWTDYFGNNLARKICNLMHLKNDGERPMKYAAYNPWYGKFWFVLRIPKCVPTIFFSINTPWRSFYIGNKAYRIDPFENDMSWTNKKDEQRAREFSKGTTKVLTNTLYYALAPSASIRSHR